MQRDRFSRGLETLEDRLTPATVGLSIPQDLSGFQGTTVTVPLNLSVAGGNLNVAGGLYVVTWDPTQFTVSNPRLGPATPDTKGFSLTGVPDNVDGKLIVSFTSTEGVDLTTGNYGATILADFAIKTKATPGPTRIDLEQFIDFSTTQIGDINGNDLVLSPAPTNANTDANDGILNIVQADRSATLAIPQTFSGTPGSVITVPLNLTINSPGGENLLAADVALSFDATRLSAGNLRLGTALPGFTLTQQIDNVAGTIRLSSSGTGTLVAPNTTKAAFLVDFTIKSDATAGVTILDLEALINPLTTAITTTDDEILAFSPPITNAGTDASDGRLTVNAGPNVISVGPITPDPRNTAVSTVNVVLSEPALAGTFTTADITLKRNNVAVSLSGVTVTLLSGSTYQISGLTSLTTPEGDYLLSIDATGIQNGAGLAGVGVGSDLWTMDTTAPNLVSFGPVTPDPRNTAVGTIRLLFSESLNETTFTLADFALTRNGSPVTLTGATLSRINATTFDIGNLTTLTTTDGIYALTLTLPGLADPAGNIGVGTPSESWTMDTTGPIVTSVGPVSPDPRNIAVSSIDVTFSEPIDLATFTAVDVSLTRDGTPVTLSGITTALVSGTTYRISGLSSFTGSSGAYVLTVTASGINDVLGNAGTGTGSDSWIVDATAPLIITVGPVTPDPRNTAVSTIDVTFSELINLATFTIADVSLTRDSTPVTLSGITTALVSGTTYRISGLSSFTAASGTYLLTVTASGITDVIGNAGNGTGSDSWIVDATAPLITTVDPVTPDPRNTAISTIDVTFSELIDLTTFTAADLSLTRDSSPVTLSGITTAFVSGTTYRISGLASFTAASGTYLLTVTASGINDVIGNAGTGTGSDSWIVDATAPLITTVGPVTPDPRNTAVSTIDVTFSELINLATFTIADVSLTRDSTPITLSGITTALVSGTTYRISGLSSFTAASGTYLLTVTASGITDVIGNAGTGTGSDSWIVDATAPLITTVGPVTPDPRNTAISTIDVTFSEFINLATFTIADVSLTRDGTPVTLSGITTALVSGTTYRISGLSSLTAVSGTYLLTVTASGITDVIGNAGTGTGSDSWTIDATAPFITTVGPVTPDPRNTAISSIDVTFSELIDLATFTAADVSLTRDSSPVTLSGITTAFVSGTTYRISGLSSFTAASGTYALTVTANGITDVIGNAGTGTGADSWVVDLTGPSIVSFGPITPDPRNTAVATVDVVFTEPLDLTNFVPTFTLLRDGSPVTLSGITFTLVSGSTYRINGLGSFTAATGTYSLSMTATGVVDGLGNTGTATGSDSWIVDATAPTIVSISPITPDPRNTAVSTIDVTFSELINLATFTIADVSLTRDSTPVTLSGITTALVSGTTYRISGLTSFTAASGTYLLTVTASGITDVIGNAGTGTGSDSWIVDATAPFITSVGPVTPDPRNTAISTIDVTFSEAIDLATFTAADVSLTRDSSPVTLSGITTALVSGTTYRISGLSSLTAASGTYLLTVTASGITDVIGNAGTGIGSDSWIVDTTAPTIVSVGPVTPDPRATAISTIDVTFSEPIDLATFTTADISLTRNGSTITLSGITIALVSGSVYRISGLSSFTAASGTYLLTVTATGINDLIGNAGSGTGSDSWIVDATAPTIVSVGPVTPNPRNTAISTIDVTFTEPIDLTTFTAADVSLTRNSGSVSLSGITTALVTGNTYRISGLTGFTGIEGNYLLTVTASGITDIQGNAGLGSGSDQWIVDTTGPGILSVGPVSPDPRNTAVSSIDVTFNEPIDLTSFTSADASLTLNGNPLSLSGITIALVAGNTYRIGSLTSLTGASGAYQLTLTGSGIRDLAGNAGINTVSDSWVTDSTPPTVTSIAAVTPDPRNSPIATIDVTFSEPINLASFTSADVSLFRDGNLITLGGISIDLVAGSTYRISGLTSFTGTGGTYVLTVFASGITDPSGNAGTGTGTESWIVDVNLPLILNVESVSPNPRNSAVSSIDVTFSKPINLASFTAADLSLTRDGVPVNLTGVSIASIGSTQIRINVLTAPTNATGQYVLSVTGSGITDTLGNIVANDGSTMWDTDQIAPILTSLGPVSPNPRNQPVSMIEIGFSEPINASSFGFEDLTLMRDGQLISLSGAILVGLDAQHYRLESLEFVTQFEGNYTLNVNASGVADLVGNLGVGTSSFGFAVDYSGPFVTTLGPIDPDPRNTAVSSLLITFNEPILASSLAIDDVYLSRDGLIQSNAGLVIVQETSTTYRIQGLALRTAVAGTYTLSINQGTIVDQVGNSGFGFVSESWILDLSAPFPVSITIPPRPPAGFPNFGAVSDATVSFTESIDINTFDPADLSLTRDGVPISLTGLTITPDGSGNTFRVDGLAPLTVLQGNYLLSVRGANVRDLAGNNGTGEINTSFAVDSPPTVVSSTVVGAALTNAEFIDFLVTFSEPVQDFTAANVSLYVPVDLSAGNGPSATVQSVIGTADPAVWRVTVRVRDGLESLILLDIAPGGGLRDFMGTSLGAPYQAFSGVTVDRIRPIGRVSQSSGQADPANGSTVSFDVSFTESVSGLGADDFRLNGIAGATIVSVSGSGTAYTVIVGNLGTSGGTLTLDLIDSGAFDKVNNGNLIDNSGDRAITIPSVKLPPVIPPVIPPVTSKPQPFAVGAGPGGPPIAILYRPNGQVGLSITAFDASFTGGVRVATGDFNGDGEADLVVGSGPGSATLVTIYDGLSGAVLFSVAPFESAFVGGIFVAAGDINGDGRADLVITPDEGGGPRCRIFSGNGFTQIADFFGIEDPNFRGGVRPTLGDVNRDGAADLVISAGFGGGPRVAVFNGKSLEKIVPDFFLFEDTLRNGAYVAAGDIDGDGYADVIGGGGPGGGPRIYALSGRDFLDGNSQAAQRANFFGGDSNSRGGVRVAARDVNGDGKADLIIGSGQGTAPRVTVYNGAQTNADGIPPVLLDILPFEGFLGGVFVG